MSGSGLGRELGIIIKELLVDKIMATFLKTGKYIIIIIILIIGIGILAYTKRMPDQNTNKIESTGEPVRTKNSSEPTAEMKAQAIKMFIKSKELYEADNLLALLVYVKETNDIGELNDFKTQTGLSVEDTIKALQNSPRDPSKPNASNVKLVRIMSFLTEDFFKQMPNIAWQVMENPETGSIDVLAEFENNVIINDAGDKRPSVCFLGATQKKDGIWRALPIAAFRCE